MVGQNTEIVTATGTGDKPLCLRFWLATIPTCELSPFICNQPAGQFHYSLNGLYHSAMEVLYCLGPLVSPWPSHLNHFGDRPSYNLAIITKFITRTGNEKFYLLSTVVCCCQRQVVHVQRDPFSRVPVTADARHIEWLVVQSEWVNNSHKGSFVNCVYNREFETTVV